MLAGVVVVAVVAVVAVVVAIAVVVAVGAGHILGMLWPINQQLIKESMGK